MYNLQANFLPAGDQAAAIAQLSEGILAGCLALLLLVLLMVRFPPLLIAVVLAVFPKVALGLDVTEGSAERDLFEIIAKRDLAKQKFMEGETPPPLKDQVEWVAKEVRTRLGKKIEQTDERRRKAREHQERNQPLTRGGDLKPPGEETLSEPVSLVSIRQQDIERRRERHRGV